MLSAQLESARIMYVWPTQAPNLGIHALLMLIVRMGFAASRRVVL